MSRVDWNDDEQFDGQFALWQANTLRSIKGKKGQQSLKDLRTALVALREYHGPRLIEGALCTVGGAEREGKFADNEYFQEDISNNITRQGEGVCAVGAFAWWKSVQANNSVGEAFKGLPTLLAGDSEFEETAHVGEQYGMPKMVAYEVAYRNDEVYVGRDITPEDRYNKFISWLNSVIVE